MNQKKSESPFIEFEGNLLDTSKLTPNERADVWTVLNIDALHRQLLDNLEILQNARVGIVRDLKRSNQK